MSASSLFYSPGDVLSLPELAAARLDGSLIEVGEGYMPADTVETPAARARSIRALVNEESVACGATAAWIHGARDAPPARHHIQRLGPASPRPRPGPRVHPHDSAPRDGEVVLIAGISVTTPSATAVHLALTAAEEDDAHAWLRGLCAVQRGAASGGHALLAARGRVPGKHAALRMLDELRSQEDVTR